MPNSAPAPQQGPPNPKQRNVLGLVAFIVAVVGFIFGCIPGALIVGWILLPIAFILSIVSLFMKGRKALGITGLILSIVGTIVAVGVFIGVVANAANDAFGGSETTVNEPAAEEPVAEEQSANGEAPAPAGDSAVGTRENPAAIGSEILGDEWKVTVNGFTADANQIAAEANQFNDAPPAGSHYSTVNYTVTYTGEDSSSAAMVGVSLVTSTGEVIESYESMVSLSDSMGLEELYNGGTATGSTAFTVPDGAEVLIRVRPGMFADEVFVRP